MRPIEIGSTGKLQLRFLGGVNEIGGNIVLFSKGERGYFFDFGLELNKFRIAKRLGYSKRLIYNAQFSSLLDPIRRSLKVMNVFISHGHIDHWTGLTVLPNEIKRNFTIYLPLYTHYMLVGHLRDFATPQPFSMKIDYKDPSKGVFNDGQIEITPFPVDHSIPGSCCFTLKDESTQKLFLYTGDFRTHGILSEVLQRPFWNYLKGTKIEALISEGTQFGHICEPYHEAEIASKIEKLIASYKGKIVFAVTSPNDLFRLKVLVGCGNSAGRTVLVSDDGFKTKLKTLESFMKSKDTFVKLLEEVTFKELFETSLIPSSGNARIELLRKIKLKPGQYLVISPSIKSLFKVLSELTEISRGGCCILSLSEFFEEELGVKTVEVISELSKTGLTVFRAHSSGHVFPDEIARILKILKPKKVFLLHTEDPVNFRSFLMGKGVKSQIICPRKGQVFQF